MTPDDLGTVILLLSPCHAHVRSNPVHLCRWRLTDDHPRRPHQVTHQDRLQTPDFILQTVNSSADTSEERDSLKLQLDQINNL